jgi:hypothetical protein
MTACMTDKEAKIDKASGPFLPTNFIINIIDENGAYRKLHHVNMNVIARKFRETGTSITEIKSHGQRNHLIP